MTERLGVHPIDDGVLVDYWFGELPEADEERVEGHLLACDSCGDRLQRLVAIGQGVRELASEGAVGVVISPLFLATADRRGVRVRQYTVQAGGSVDCTITAEDDLLVTRLLGDFRGAERVDLVATVPGAGEQRATDLPVDPSAPEILIAMDMPFVRALGETVVRMRLVAPGPTGDRLLAEYTFNHRPSRA